MRGFCSSAHRLIVPLTVVFYVCAAAVVAANAALPTTADALHPPQKASMECPIKGDISWGDERIYHAPADRYYGVTSIDESNGERWFCSAPTAEDAGWRRAKK
jgi:hypothetical protein